MSLTPTEQIIEDARKKAEADKKKAEADKKKKDRPSVGVKGEKSLSGLSALPNTTAYKTVGRPSSPDSVAYEVPGGKPYTTSSAKSLYLTWSPDLAASVQEGLSTIPGLYPKGRGPKMVDGGFTGVFSTYDFEALEKVMVYADTAGLSSDNQASWVKAMNTLNQNPDLARDYFRVKETGGPRVVPTTPDAMLVSELDSVYQGIFDTDASNKESDEYIRLVHEVELKQKGQISGPQREDIRMSIVQKTAQNKIKSATDSGTAEDLAALSKGTLGQTIKAIRAAYNDSGVPTSERKILAQSRLAIRSESEFNNVLSGIQDDSATFFPAFAPDIKAGKTVRQKLSPYISLASQVWEVPEDQIPIDSLYHVASDATKPLDIPTFTNSLYSDPRYMKTQGYKDTQMNDLQSLIREAGLG